MATLLPRSRSAHGLFALLFLLALAMRVAVPGGFMPVAGADGFTIGVCSAGSGERATFIPANDPPAQDDDQTAAPLPCLFAMPPGCCLPATIGAAGPAPAIAHAIPRTRVIADLVIHRMAAPPPPAQAPPGHG